MLVRYYLLNYFLGINCIPVGDIHVILVFVTFVIMQEKSSNFSHTL